MKLDDLINNIKIFNDVIVLQANTSFALVGYSAKVVPSIYAEHGSEHEGNPQFDWCYPNNDKDFIANNPTTSIPKNSLIFLSQASLKEIQSEYDLSSVFVEVYSVATESKGRVSAEDILFKCSQIDYSSIDVALKYN